MTHCAAPRQTDMTLFGATRLAMHIAFYNAKAEARPIADGNFAVPFNETQLSFLATFCSSASEALTDFGWYSLYQHHLAASREQVAEDQRRAAERVAEVREAVQRARAEGRSL